MNIQLTNEKKSIYDEKYAYIIRHMDNDPSLYTADLLCNGNIVAHLSYRANNCFTKAFIKPEPAWKVNQIQKDKFREEMAVFSQEWDKELEVRKTAAAIETLRKAEGILDSEANAKVAELEERLENAKNTFRQQKAEIESLKAQLTAAGQVKEVTVQDPKLIAENEALKAENAQLKAELKKLNASYEEALKDNEFNLAHIRKLEEKAMAKPQSGIEEENKYAIKNPMVNMSVEDILAEDDDDDIFGGDFDIPAVIPAPATVESAPAKEEEFSFETSDDMAYGFIEEVVEESQIPEAVEETPAIKEETAVDTDYQNNWGQIVFMAGGKLSEATAYRLQDAGLDAADFEDYKDSLNSYGFSAAEISEINAAMAACGWL